MKVPLGVALAPLLILASFETRAEEASTPKPLPDKVYMQVGAHVYRVDAGSFLANHRQVIETGSGCIDVSVQKVAGEEEADFGLGARVTDLGTAEAAAAALGQDPSTVPWETVVTRRTCLSAGETTVTILTADDEISAVTPAGVDGTQRDAPITVNGLTQRIPATHLRQLGDAILAGRRVDDLARGQEWRTFHAQLRDEKRTANRTLALLRFGDRIERNYALPIYPNSTDCALPCAKCGASLFFGIGIGTATIIVSCATVPATFGLTGLGCIGAIAGAVSFGTNAGFTCASCDDCLHPDPPEGSCPSGYHFCCESCCQNDYPDPPECCPPPFRVCEGNVCQLICDDGGGNGCDPRDIGCY